MSDPTVSRRDAPLGSPMVRKLLDHELPTPLADRTVLVLAHDLIRLRQAAADAKPVAFAPADLARARRACFDLLPDRSEGPLSELIRSAGGLAPVAVEALLTMVLIKIGLIQQRRLDGSCILDALAHAGEDAFAVVEQLVPGAELFAKGLCVTEAIEPGYDPNEAVILDDRVLAACIGDRPAQQTVGPFATQDEALEILADLFGRYRRQFSHRGTHNGILQRRSLERLARVWSQRLQRSPDFPIRDLRRWSGDALQIILICLCRELGMIASDDELFTGRGLLTAMYAEAYVHRQLPDLVAATDSLIGAEVLRARDGGRCVASGSAHERLGWSFEIAPAYLDRLGIAPQRLGQQRCRPPRFGLERLVLAPAVTAKLDLVVTQARRSDLLFERWGLGETLASGRAVTLLFSGPPGVGKTACAEALAYELDRPLMSVDYAQLLDSWLGGTEKRIVSTFAEARTAGAVLFFDEADTMFVDRDRSQRHFQIQQTNVLLTELERFDGWCILATNRAPVLDGALARRISLDIAFDPPDPAMRYRIWRTLVPERMPLAADVDFQALAAVDLTGGTIKNAVLNAARYASLRGDETIVTQRDFVQAIQEQVERNCGATEAPIAGFL